MERIISIFLLLSVVSSLSMAQVYKWVDSEGNVHFSDSPIDADRGEQVTVDSSNVMEGGADLAQSASRNRERVMEEQRKAAEAAATAEEVPDPCVKDLERYELFTKVHKDKNSRPYYVYTDNEDGSLMSQKDHEKMVDDMKASLIKRGCM